MLRVNGPWVFKGFIVLKLRINIYLGIDYGLWVLLTLKAYVMYVKYNIISPASFNTILHLRNNLYYIIYYIYIILYDYYMIYDMMISYDDMIMIII